MAITITLTDEQVGEVLKSFAAYMTGGSKHAPSIVQTIAPAKKRRERKIKAIVKEKRQQDGQQQSHVMRGVVAIQ